MAPEPPAAPEAMSAEGLAGLGAETDTEATILRLAPVNSGPAAPVAFLIHGGTVPVEVSRDVVIGRDPDARALTGRPVATVLRVPSPATEISRSHCAVMMTTPGSWALMDLGSANGTVLRHADGSFQDVTPMVTIALKRRRPHRRWRGNNHRVPRALNDSHAGRGAGLRVRPTSVCPPPVEKTPRPSAPV